MTASNFATTAAGIDRPSEKRTTVLRARQRAHAAGERDHRRALGVAIAIAHHLLEGLFHALGQLEQHSVDASARRDHAPQPARLHTVLAGRPAVRFRARRRRDVRTAVAVGRRRRHVARELCAGCPGGALDGGGEASAIGGEWLESLQRRVDHEHAGVVVGRDARLQVAAGGVVSEGASLGRQAVEHERDHGRALRRAWAVGARRRQWRLGGITRPRCRACPRRRRPGAISSNDATRCLTPSSSSSKSDGSRSTIGAPLASRTTTSTTTAVVDVAKPEPGVWAGGSAGVWAAAGAVRARARLRQPRGLHRRRGSTRAPGASHDS